MDVKRDVVVALLEKMGAPHTTKISMDRAVQKLKRYIQKNGMPVGMTWIYRFSFWTALSVEILVVWSAPIFSSNAITTSLFTSIFHPPKRVG